MNTACFAVESTVLLHRYTAACSSSLYSESEEKPRKHGVAQLLVFYKSKVSSLGTSEKILSLLHGVCIAHGSL